MSLKRFSLALIILLVLLATAVGISANRAHAATVCTPTSTVGSPYAKDGAGDVCFQTASICTYINSWNVTTLEVNGTAYTNVYTASNTIAALNGMYVIHYVSAAAWGHFESGGTCSTSSATPTNTIGATSTPTAGAAFTATRTPTTGATNSPSPTRTMTGTATRTPTAGISPTPTLTLGVTRTSTAVLTKTATLGVSPTRTSTASLTNTATLGVTATRTLTPTKTATPSVSPTGNPGAAIVRYKANDTSATTGSISLSVQVQNSGTTVLALSSVKVRYWYTIDGLQSQTFACDYSQIGCANITGTFTRMSNSATTANHYFEIGFASAAGSLAPGASTGDIQLRFYKTDFSSYTQTNDYSFDSTMIAYGQNIKVTGYVNGALAFGTEPAVAPLGTPNPNVLYVGRFNTSDPAGPRSAWSATTIKANFSGTGISANLYSSGDNWYTVVIDGVVQAPLHVSADVGGAVTLASGLAAGNHTIELVRRTEAWVGDVQFRGFTATGGQMLAAPTPSTKRIEFIGDSITAGYGNEGTSPSQHFTTQNENAYLSYGSVTARALGADQFTVAWSGKGIVRNYDGSTTELIPNLYPRILPWDTTTLWNPAQWTPQVVVINLGTNDFAVDVPNKTTFTSGYANFVTQIRSQYPGAHIYLALGPLLSYANLTSARDYITTVVNQFNAAGDSKVHFIEFPMQDGSLGYGEDYHPSVAEDAAMSNQLVTQIKADLGW